MIQERARIPSTCADDIPSEWQFGAPQRSVLIGRDRPQWAGRQRTCRPATGYKSIPSDNASPSARSMPRNKTVLSILA